MNKVVKELLNDFGFFKDLYKEEKIYTKNVVQVVIGGISIIGMGYIILTYLFGRF